MCSMAGVWDDVDGELAFLLGEGAAAPAASPEDGSIPTHY